MNVDPDSFAIGTFVPSFDRRYDRIEVGNN